LLLLGTFLLGISPVIATLLLIIIAVAAGLLIYMWISGYISGQTSSLTTQPPKIAGASAKWAGTNSIINVLDANPAPTDTSVSLRACGGTITELGQCKEIGEVTNVNLKAGELKRIVITGLTDDDTATVFLCTGSTCSDESVVDSIVISVPPS